MFDNTINTIINEKYEEEKKFTNGLTKYLSITINHTERNI